MTKHKVKIDYEGTQKQIAQLFRDQLRQYDDNPLATWRWWSGFILGCIFIAALNWGDVWLCVGSCGGNQ